METRRVAAAPVSSWVKIKKAAYSQAEGRRELFKAPNAVGWGRATALRLPIGQGWVVT